MGMATRGQKFLRGFQVTDAEGNATFATIYPGWYQGRTVHIHMKVRTKASTGEAYEFTSQLFFDDALSDRIFSTVEAYHRTSARDIRNASDGIFRQSSSQLTLAPVKSGDGHTATFKLALDLSDAAVGRPDGGGRGNPGRRRGGAPFGGGRGTVQPPA